MATAADAAPAAADSASLLAAASLKNETGARLSKRASYLLRSECDAFAAELLGRAFAVRGGAADGPLEADDLWAAVLGDRSLSFLVDRLGLWKSACERGSEPLLPDEVRLPPPPAGLPTEGEATGAPPLVWHRVRGGASVTMHEGLLEPSAAPSAGACGAAGGDAAGGGSWSRGEPASLSALAGSAGRLERVHGAFLL